MLLEHRQDRTGTDQWQPMRRIGIPRIDAAASELFNMRVTLASTPSPDWREMFIRFESGVERSTSLIGNPCLVGDAISLCGVQERDLDSWFRLIDTKIAGANFQYTERTPFTLASVQEREAAGAQHQREAQVRADRIAQLWKAPDA